MPKRFTATEKWLDPWFCGLSNNDRLFWIYLLDNCDHAGIWQVNKILMSTYFPGYEPDLEKFGDRIQVLNPEKWFIRKFVDFQYGTLNPDNRAHASVLVRLQKEGAYKGLIRPLQGPKDMDKDKESVGVGVGKGRREGSKEQAEWFETIWLAYPPKGRVKKKQAFERFCASVKDLETAKRCANAVDRYIACDRVKGNFIQNASTWFGDWEQWENYEEATNGPTHS